MSDKHSLEPNYEFLDHTADVQIHAWGKNMEETFEAAATAMSAYITDISSIEIQTKESIQVEAEDLKGLLYRFLDEVLYLFNAEPYLIAKRVRVLELETGPEFRLKAECYGETFNLDKHMQGTEIKAITYSAMQITNQPDNCEVYFIVDI